MAKKSISDLKVILEAQKTDALSGDASSKLSDERSAAMEYYLGDVSKDMPSVDGRSRAVSSDVADTIEGLMPPLMEIFCGSDEVVKFEPVGPEDVQAAEQETDYVNHVFMQQNPGFLVLYSFIKDALLSKTGIVKVFWEEKEREERETYLDQDDGAFAAIASAPGVEIVEHTENDGPEGKLHDITVSFKKPYACARVEPVPPEEFGIARRARNIRDADYCYHEVIRTESDLIEQGFDAAQIRALPSYAETSGTEQNSRDTVEETGNKQGDESLNRALRPIRVTEHYIRMDYEGDGKVALYRITSGGEQGDVLTRKGEPEVVREDMIRFAAMTPVIMTHRFFGRSIADLVMDIQRIKTALTRGMLDNLYLHNNPRVVVAEEDQHDNTLDDLLVSRPGGIVRVRRNAATAAVWQTVPDITGAIYPALQYFDATREWRTGVTRQGQGVDPDALQNQVATIANQMEAASQAKMKLIARIFAETGIKDLFWLLHATIRKHGKKAETVRLRNQWVAVDPREWKTRNDMAINVGLGSGNKSQRMAQLMAMIGLQKEAIANGLTNLVQPQHLFNSAKAFTKLIELKNVEDYFSDPKTQPPLQPQPDPKMIELQMKAQLDERSDQRKAEIEKVQAQADIATQQQKTQAELALGERRFELERELKLLDHQIKREESARDAEMRQQQHAVDMQGRQADQHRAAQDHERGQDEKTRDFAMRQADREADRKVKESEAKVPKPKPEPVPKADKADPAMAAAITALAQSQAVVARALEKSSAPRKISKGKDGSYRSEAE